MKTITFAMLLFFLPAFMLAQKQEQNQNPNAQKAHQVYSKKLDSHEKTMGTTIDLTYEARDHMEEKARRRDERREFRRELKLERVRNRRQRVIYDPYYNPWW